MEPRLPRGSETATAGGFDADEVTRGEVPRGPRGQSFAVDEVASGRARIAAAGSSRSVTSALGDQRQAAGLEGAPLAAHPVAAAVCSGAAGAEPELVPLDAERIHELEGLGRSSQCV